MGNFVPGKVVHTFTTKKGNQAIIRYPSWEDLDEMTDYINELSKEDTFITFSGEIITKENEAKFLSDSIRAMEFKNKIILIVFINGKYAGISNVDRNEKNKKRSLHIGIFGISVRKPYRGEGIGKVLAEKTIEEAKKMIPGLTKIILEVYGENDKAKLLYEKLGFIEYGNLSEGLLYRGRFINEVLMCLKLP